MASISFEQNMAVNSIEEIAIEHVEELFEFLQGNLPSDIELDNGEKSKLTWKQAKTVIWYLQERLRIIPDNFEVCDGCGVVRDSHFEGEWIEDSGQWKCDFCIQ